jgi:hypothetical protein
LYYWNLRRVSSGIGALLSVAHFGNKMAAVAVKLVGISEA